MTVRIVESIFPNDGLGWFIIGVEFVIVVKVSETKF